MNFLDDPIGDFSIFPTYLVSRLAKQHVTVVLSGDGADELFGGYETYVADGLAGRYRLIPSPVRRFMIEPLVDQIRPRPAKKGLINKAKRFIEGARQPEELAHCRWRKFLDSDTRQRIFSPALLESLACPADEHILQLFSKAGARDNLDRSLYVDVKSYLCDNILTKVDRMSMAVSLEARVPYLDTGIVDLAFQIPARLKVRNGNTKVLLKQIAARQIPASCVYRQKEGFSIPIKTWLGTQFRPIMDELLSEARIRSGGLFDVAAIKTLKKQHLSGQFNHSHLLWSLIVFEAWRDRWLTSGQMAEVG
jgi:asparagine synthase (glutamine-hydrolysing)